MAFQVQEMNCANNNWIEGTLTWNLFNSTYKCGTWKTLTTGTTAGSGAFCVEITGVSFSRINAHGLMLNEQVAQNKSASFYSKEKQQTSAPRLEVTFMSCP